MPIRLTVNTSVRKPHDLQILEFQDFKDVYDAVQASAAAGEKDESDLIVPVAEWHELYRVDENVKTMARIFMVDLDAKTEAEIDHVLGSLQAAGLCFFAYTTHSHLQPIKQGLCCYRVALELDSEYPPDRHKELWDYVQEHLLHGQNDEGTRKISLGYYLPQYPPHAAASFDCAYFKGQPLKIGAQTPPPVCTPDPGGIPRQVATGVTPSILSTNVDNDPPHADPAEVIPTEPPPSIYQLETYLTAWLRQSRDIERKETAKAARALLKGENLIPVHEGKRNNFLASLAGYLALQFPRSTGIASLFQGVGWDLFNKDGKYPLDVFEDMINRFQLAEAANEAARAAEEAEKRRHQIRLATGGARDHEITDEEVQNLRGVFGDNWRQHLITINKKDLYFLRPDGTYDPHPILRENLFIGAQQRLAVFGDWVEYTYEDIRGLHQKTPAQFLQEYGHVDRRTVFDMGKPYGGYDLVSQTVYLETAKPTAEPVYHQEIHTWFEHLGTYAIDMLSVMPKLTDMTPALVLTGVANGGKTLLAIGVGRVYGRDPIDGEDAFTQFNAAMLLRQPIIFMDEKVSSAYEKEGTTLIRKFVTQKSRFLDEKFQARVELLGYPRLIIAANNADVLTTKQNMSDADHEAFAERIVHVDTDPGIDYLSNYDRPYIQANWLDGGMLPQHIMWLHENWQVQNPGRRFTVANNDTALHEGLVSRSGSAGDVAYWLLAYLESPERAKHLPVEYNHERKYLRANAKALIEGWGLYLDKHKAPTPHIISQALKSLSLPNRQKIKCVGSGKERWFHAWQVDPRKLRGQNDVHGTISDFDDLFDLTEKAK